MGESSEKKTLLSSSLENGSCEKDADLRKKKHKKKNSSEKSEETEGSQCSKGKGPKAKRKSSPKPVPHSCPLTPVAEFDVQVQEVDTTSDKSIPSTSCTSKPKQLTVEKEKTSENGKSSPPLSFTGLFSKNESHLSTQSPSKSKPKVLGNPDIHESISPFCQYGTEPSENAVSFPRESVILEESFDIYGDLDHLGSENVDAKNREHLKNTSLDGPEDHWAPGDRGAKNCEEDASNCADLDLYSDFIQEETFRERDQKIQELQDENNRLSQTVAEFRDCLSQCSSRCKKLQTDNTKLLNENEILRNNISSLLKTAQGEIQRKDREILNYRLCLQNRSTHELKRKHVPYVPHSRKSEVGHFRKGPQDDEGVSRGKRYNQQYSSEEKRGKSGCKENESHSERNSPKRKRERTPTLDGISDRGQLKKRRALEQRDGGFSPGREGLAQETEQNYPKSKGFDEKCPERYSSKKDGPEGNIFEENGPNTTYPEVNRPEREGPRGNGIERDNLEGDGMDRNGAENTDMDGEDPRGNLQESLMKNSLRANDAAFDQTRRVPRRKRTRKKKKLYQSLERNVDVQEERRDTREEGRSEYREDSRGARGDKKAKRLSKEGRMDDRGSSQGERRGPNGHGEIQQYENKEERPSSREDEGRQGHFAGYSRKTVTDRKMLLHEEWRGHDGHGGVPRNDNVEKKQSSKEDEGKREKIGIAPRKKVMDHEKSLHDKRRLHVDDVETPKDNILEKRQSSKEYEEKEEKFGSPHRSPNDTERRQLSSHGETPKNNQGDRKVKREASKGTNDVGKVSNRKQSKDVPGSHEPDIKMNGMEDVADQTGNHKSLKTSAQIGHGTNENNGKKRNFQGEVDDDAFHDHDTADDEMRRKDGLEQMVTHEDPRSSAVMEDAINKTGRKTLKRNSQSKLDHDSLDCHEPVNELRGGEEDESERDGTHKSPNSCALLGNAVKKTIDDPSKCDCLKGQLRECEGREPHQVDVIDNGHILDRDESVKFIAKGKSSSKADADAKSDHRNPSDKETVVRSERSTEQDARNTSKKSRRVHSRADRLQGSQNEHQTKQTEHQIKQTECQSKQTEHQIKGKELGTIEVQHQSKEAQHQIREAGGGDSGAQDPLTSQGSQSNTSNVSEDMVCEQKFSTLHGEENSITPDKGKERVSAAKGQKSPEISFSHTKEQLPSELDQGSQLFNLMVTSVNRKSGGFEAGDECDLISNQSQNGQDRQLEIDVNASLEDLSQKEDSSAKLKCQGMPPSADEEVTENAKKVAKPVSQISVKSSCTPLKLLSNHLRKENRTPSAAETSESQNTILSCGKPFTKVIRCATQNDLSEQFSDGDILHLHAEDSYDCFGDDVRKHLFSRCDDVEGSRKPLEVSQGQCPASPSQNETKTPLQELNASEEETVSHPRDDSVQEMMPEAKKESKGWRERIRESSVARSMKQDTTKQIIQKVKEKYDKPGQNGKKDDLHGGSALMKTVGDGTDPRGTKDSMEKKYSNRTKIDSTTRSKENGEGRGAIRHAGCPGSDSGHSDRSRGDYNNKGKYQRSSECSRRSDRDSSSRGRDSCKDKYDSRDRRGSHDLKDKDERRVGDSISSRDRGRSCNIKDKDTTSDKDFDRRRDGRSSRDWKNNDKIRDRDRDDQRDIRGSHVLKDKDRVKDQDLRDKRECHSVKNTEERRFQERGRGELDNASYRCRNDQYLGSEKKHRELSRTRRDRRDNDTGTRSKKREQDSRDERRKHDKMTRDSVERDGRMRNKNHFRSDRDYPKESKRGDKGQDCSGSASRSDRGIAYNHRYHEKRSSTRDRPKETNSRERMQETQGETYSKESKNGDRSTAETVLRSSNRLEEKDMTGCDRSGRRKDKGRELKSERGDSAKMEKHNRTGFNKSGKATSERRPKSSKKDDPLSDGEIVSDSEDEGSEQSMEGLDISDVQLSPVSRCDDKGMGTSSGQDDQKWDQETSDMKIVGEDLKHQLKDSLSTPAEVVSRRARHSSATGNSLSFDGVEVSFDAEKSSDVQKGGIDVVTYKRKEVQEIGPLVKESPSTEPRIMHPGKVDPTDGETGVRSKVISPGRNPLDGIKSNKVHGGNNTAREGTAQVERTADLEMVLATEEKKKTPKRTVMDGNTLTKIRNDKPEVHKTACNKIRKHTEFLRKTFEEESSPRKGKDEMCCFQDRENDSQDFTNCEDLTSKGDTKRKRQNSEPRKGKKKRLETKHAVSAKELDVEIECEKQNNSEEDEKGFEVLAAKQEEKRTSKSKTWCRMKDCSDRCQEECLALRRTKRKSDEVWKRKVKGHKTDPDHKEMEDSETQAEGVLQNEPGSLKATGMSEAKDVEEQLPKRVMNCDLVDCKGGALRSQILTEGESKEELEVLELRKKEEMEECSSRRDLEKGDGNKLVMENRNKFGCAGGTPDESLDQEESIEAGESFELGNDDGLHGMNEDDRERKQNVEVEEKILQRNSSEIPFSSQISPESQVRNEKPILEDELSSSDDDEQDNMTSESDTSNSESEREVSSDDSGSSSDGDGASPDSDCDNDNPADDFHTHDDSDAANELEGGSESEASRESSEEEEGVPKDELQRFPSATTCASTSVEVKGKGDETSERVSASDGTSLERDEKLEGLQENCEEVIQQTSSLQEVQRTTGDDSQRSPFRTQMPSSTAAVSKKSNSNSTSSDDISHSSPIKCRDSIHPESNSRGAETVDGSKETVSSPSEPFHKSDRVTDMSMENQSLDEKDVSIEGMGATALNIFESTLYQENDAKVDASDSSELERNLPREAEENKSGGKKMNRPFRKDFGCKVSKSKEARMSAWKGKEAGKKQKSLKNTKTLLETWQRRRRIERLKLCLRKDKDQFEEIDGEGQEESPKKGRGVEVNRRKVLKGREIERREEDEEQPKKKRKELEVSSIKGDRGQRTASGRTLSGKTVDSEFLQNEEVEHISNKAKQRQFGIEKTSEVSRIRKIDICQGDKEEVGVWNEVAVTDKEKSKMYESTKFKDSKERKCLPGIKKNETRIQSNRGDVGREPHSFKKDGVRHGRKACIEDKETVHEDGMKGNSEETFHNKIAQQDDRFKDNESSCSKRLAEKCDTTSKERTVHMNAAHCSKRGLQTFETNGNSRGQNALNSCEIEIGSGKYRRTEVNTRQDSFEDKENEGLGNLNDIKHLKIHQENEISERKSSEEKGSGKESDISSSACFLSVDGASGSDLSESDVFKSDAMCDVLDSGLDWKPSLMKTPEPFKERSIEKSTKTAMTILGQLLRMKHQQFGPDLVSADVLSFSDESQHKLGIPEGLKDKDLVCQQKCTRNKNTSDDNTSSMKVSNIENVAKTSSVTDSHSIPLDWQMSAKKGSQNFRFEKSSKFQGDIDREHSSKLNTQLSEDTTPKKMMNASNFPKKKVHKSNKAFAAMSHPQKKSKFKSKSKETDSPNSVYCETHDRMNKDINSKSYLQGNGESLKKTVRGQSSTIHFKNLSSSGGAFQRGESFGLMSEELLNSHAYNQKDSPKPKKSLQPQETSDSGTFSKFCPKDSPQTIVNTEGDHSTTSPASNVPEFPYSEPAERSCPSQSGSGRPRLGKAGVWSRLKHEHHARQRAKRRSQRSYSLQDASHESQRCDESERNVASMGKNATVFRRREKLKQKEQLLLKKREKLLSRIKERKVRSNSVY